MGSGKHSEQADVGTGDQKVKNVHRLLLQQRSRWSCSEQLRGTGRPLPLADTKQRSAAPHRLAGKEEPWDSPSDQDTSATSQSPGALVTSVLSVSHRRSSDASMQTTRTVTAGAEGPRDPPRTVLMRMRNHTAHVLQSSTCAVTAVAKDGGQAFSPHQAGTGFG